VDETLQKFGDELEKIAVLGQLWDQLRDIFDTKKRKAKKDVVQHLKSKDPRKWDTFVANAANSPEFINQLRRNDSVPAKDALHAVSMASLAKGPTVGDVESQSVPGNKYQIRKIPGRKLACTCGDWRYKGSVNPGYECKHIKAHKQGLNKVAGFNEMTQAFFDELQKIRSDQHMDAEEGRRDQYGDNDSAAPFSNILTQDEEPTTYNPRPAQHIDEPEVILGGGQ
jgi:hypothetical protein